MSIPKTEHTFTIPMTREFLESVRDRLTASGFPILGDQGEVKYRGVTFGYFFFAAYGGTVLRFTIVNKSMLTSLIETDAGIEKQIRDYFTDLEITMDLEKPMDKIVFPQGD